MQKDESPESLRTWNKIYLGLILSLIVFIALLYFFTQYFK